MARTCTNALASSPLHIETGEYQCTTDAGRLLSEPQVTREVSAINRCFVQRSVIVDAGLVDQVIE